MSNAIGDPAQLAAKEWLRQICEEKGWSLTRLAHESGLAVTTITRFVNRDVKHMLTARTIGEVAQASQMPPPPEVIARVQSETDVDTLRRALYEARLQLRDVPRDEYDELEARTVAHVYDILMEARLHGRSLDDTAVALRSSFSKQERARRRGQ